MQRYPNIFPPYNMKELGFNRTLETYCCNHKKALTWKNAARAIVEMIDPSICPNYYQTAKWKNIDMTAFPRYVVVKPIKGCSSRGVYCLKKLRNGNLVQLNDQPFDVGMIEPEQEVIAEEFIVQDHLAKAISFIPIDYKCYTFYDEVKMIVCMNRNYNPLKCTIYDRDWNVIPYTKVFKKQRGNLTDPEIEKPIHGDEIIQKAELIATRLKLFFCRIDFYSSNRGPVFGEFCPVPGSRRIHTKEWDKLMGQWCREAHAKI